MKPVVIFCNRSVAVETDDFLKFLAEFEGLAVQRTGEEHVVLNFELPAIPSLKTSVGLNFDRVRDRYGLEPGTREAEQVTETYFKFLLDRRISPYRAPELPAEPMSRDLLADPRVTSFVMPYHELDGDANRIAESISEIRKTSWIKKGYF